MHLTKLWPVICNQAVSLLENWIAMWKKERDCQLCTLPHKYNFNSVWSPTALKNIFNALDCTRRHISTVHTASWHLDFFFDFFLNFYGRLNIFGQIILGNPIRTVWQEEENVAWKNTFVASTTRSNFSTLPPSPPKSSDVLQWHRWKFTNASAGLLIT